MRMTMSFSAILLLSVISATNGATPYLKGVTDKEPLSYAVGEEIVFTVTAQEADLEESSTEVAVMIAVPAPTPVTRPFAFTVATRSSEEDQVTDLSDAFQGMT